MSAVSEAVAQRQTNVQITAHDRTEFLADLWKCEVNILRVALFENELQEARREPEKRCRHEAQFPIRKIADSFLSNVLDDEFFAGQDI